MMFRIVSALLLLALATGAPAQKVKNEFDKSTDFSRFTTYVWAKGKPVQDPLADLSIIGAVDQEMKGKNLRLGEGGKADLMVAYYAVVDSDMNLGGLADPTFETAGGAPTTYAVNNEALTARYIKKGTLVLEFVDTSTHKLVWVGTVTDVIKEQKKKRPEQLIRAMHKVFLQYPPQPNEKSKQ